MGDVLYLKQPKRFKLQEARKVLPRVQRVTDAAFEIAQPYLIELASSDLEPDRKKELSEDLGLVVDEWVDEIAKMGATARALWLVDFDSGYGYFCWHQGEEDIEYFRRYEDDVEARIPLDETGESLKGPER